MRGTTRLGSAEAGARIADLRKVKATYCNSAQQKNTHILCKGIPPFPPLNGMTTLQSYLSLFN